jgi:hypothetical protein
VEHKNIPLDAYEEGAVIEGLNRLRSEQLSQGECADFVSGVMLKIIQTPSRRPGLGTSREPADAVFGNDARLRPAPARLSPATSLTHQAGVGEEGQRGGADARRKAGEAGRSLLRRDEAR